MMYQGFSGIYDSLMAHAPYDQWVEWIEKSICAQQKETVRILDLACGTGEISVRLAEKGYDVTGVDISEDMLAQAQQKAADRKLQIHFFQQDMRDLTGHGQKFDAVVICCDSLNYLIDEKGVLDTFQNVFSLLKDNGLLLFDVHSVYKMDHVFPGSTYADQDEEISVIWQSYTGEAVHSVVHDLTFFVESGGVYERFDESHEQRTFEAEEYSRLLEAAGFEIGEITADFSDLKPGAETERHFYIAKKSKTIV
ncbi:class I SAM-dependent DNA methyltransferase [Bacillus swezeyi]|uniref:Class I SAM-dependent methyltransferase n=1 Tax=Bacillus swezeyi TaxID=1925020 RepID=A0A5M8RX04_9BACI|nr:class I SAM-dependent methyltransferase [Bacillus swezeyi]KAA6451384.1 class I SAM-dependent methyltransferase [Bacillus swezeyi]KAA6482124.1 class I SAM-dependent methyltransferase [Bacillus swezeyi]TYS35600.1 class I SAM-dependent methyltransferase [Bacillus swezeyi]